MPTSTDTRQEWRESWHERTPTEDREVKEQLVQDVAREVGRVLQEWKNKQAEEEKEKWDRKMAELEQMIRKEMNHKAGNKPPGDCKGCTERRLERDEKNQEAALLRGEVERLKAANGRLEMRLKGNQEVLESIVESRNELKERYERLKEWQRLDQVEGEVNQGKKTDSRNQGQGETMEKDKGIAKNGNYGKEAELRAQNRGVGGQKGGDGSSGSTQQVDSVTLTHDASATGGSGIDETGRGNQSNQDNATTTPRDTTPKGLDEAEWEEEKKERRARKRRVIIKGLTLLRAGRRKVELEQWLKDTLGLEVRVEKLDRLQGATWRVEFESWDSKMELLEKKEKLNKLRWGVWIADDLTDRQLEIQAWLEEQAAAWRSRGYNAKAGYQKLWVDRDCLKWDEREGILQLEKGKEIGTEPAVAQELPPPPPPPFRGRGRGRLQN